MATDELGALQNRVRKLEQQNVALRRGLTYAIAQLGTSGTTVTRAQLSLILATIT